MRTAIGIIAATLAAVLITACQRPAPDGGIVAERTHTALATADTIRLADTTEVDLVEALARARQNYRHYLTALRQYYLDKGYYDKARWAERELTDLRRVQTYRYLSDAELPGPDLRPIDAIPAADALFEDAMNYMRQGEIKLLPGIYDQEKLKIALEKFNELIRRYPTSDKIDDAAFYAAEIYKEYFNDNLRAVRYYERAWQWNPDITLPARFQAAVVYDHRLHDRAKALELYQEVLRKETFNESNVRYAAARIRELTSGRTRQAAARSPAEPSSRAPAEPAADRQSSPPPETTPVPETTPPGSTPPTAEPQPTTGTEPPPEPEPADLPAPIPTEPEEPPAG